MESPALRLKKIKNDMKNDKNGKPKSEARLLHKRHYVGQMMRVLQDYDYV